MEEEIKKWVYEFLWQISGFLWQHSSEALAIAGLLIAIGILVVIIILLLTSLGAYFVEPLKGATTFIDAGETLQAIWPNIGGYKMSKHVDDEGRHWLIPLTHNEESPEGKREWRESFFHGSSSITLWFQIWLWEKTGVRFLSLFYPQVHVHSFNIRSKLRLLEGANLKSEMTLKDRVVESQEPDGSKSSTIVTSLLFVVPRPVLIKGIYLPGDNTVINLLVHVYYQQVIPVLPVYYLKGDFFSLLDAAVESVIFNSFAEYRTPKNDDESKKNGDESMTFNHWIGLAKAGETSFLELGLKLLNATQEYRDKLERIGKTELSGYLDRIMGDAFVKKPSSEAGIASSEATQEIASSGIIHRVGFRVAKFRVINWEPGNTETKKLSDAILSKETESRLAAGVKAKADGESYAITSVAQGQASRFEKLMQALIGKGVHPNIAADVVRTQIRTENIGGVDSKITTYIEGEARTPVMVPISPEETQKPK